MGLVRLGGVCVTLSLLALSTSQMSFADTKAGAVLANKGSSAVAPCVQCHGQYGEGQATNAYPRLAGQKQAYLEKQLRDFKQGLRKNPLMQAMAQPLSPQQISDVAAYYATLSAARGVPANANPGPTAHGIQLQGIQLAEKGNWDKGIPACFACHGNKGQGIAPHFPALAGQNAAYLKKQLTDWKAATRNNDPQGLMKAVADKMSPEEINAASTYLARLP